LEATSRVEETILLRIGALQTETIRREYAQIADRQWRFLDFWGPVSNFGIPIAAVMDTQKDAEMYVLIP
jgi:hypothetical protein